MNGRMMGVLVLAIFTLSSCAIKKEAYQKVDKIAVLSFNSNERVRETSSLGEMVLTEIRDLDTNIEDVANKVRRDFFKLTPKLTGKVMKEEALLNSPGFQEYAATLDQDPDDVEKIMYAGAHFLTPEGYPFISPVKTKTMAQAFRYLPQEVNGLMVVRAFYSFSENSGLRKRVRCALTFRLINAAGDDIIRYEFSAISDNKLTSKSPEGTLDKLVEEALSKTMAKANKKFKKKL